MSLIDIAVNIIFPISLIIFVFGFFYNILQYFMVPGPPKSYSPPRKIHIGKKVFRPIYEWFRKFVFTLRENPIHVFSSIFLFHIPILVIIFLFPPHQVVLFGLFPIIKPILSPIHISQQFTEAYITDRTAWGFLDIFLNADFLSIVVIFSLTTILFIRIIRHLSGEFKSTIGDYFALILVLFIVVFGYLSTHSAGSGLYQTYLFIHISSASFLIAYIPFSKFFHFVWSHWVNLISTFYHDSQKGI